MDQFEHSCPADIVVPAPTARMLCDRAMQWWGPGAGVGANELSTTVLVWSQGGGVDHRPLGAFALRWHAPLEGEATICELAWHEEPDAGPDQVRRAINWLAGCPVAWR